MKSITLNGKRQILPLRTSYIATFSTLCSRRTKFQNSLSERLPARTRFAPSPTGNLHLGSLRTALFNYLIAKATRGKFILRIEDTDQKSRTVPGAIEKLCADLRWAGLEWDEGPGRDGPHGPYQQSQRLPVYKKYADDLIESGNAYRCFCSASRLMSLAIHQTRQGMPTEYDRHCATITKPDSNARAARGKPHVIRLKAPARYPPFDDTIYGMVVQKNLLRTLQNTGTFDDPILIKTDGFPTYHFANVVDDHLMQITDVIRGAEWMSSTPKHIAIYEALGWAPPSFTHVGLLLDQSGKKLSKRTSSTEVESFRSQGIFPETLTNFVALLGWSHGKKSDVMSLEDLVKEASMKYTKGDTIVRFEKLNFLQRRHAARYASKTPSKNPLHSLQHLAVQPIIEELDSRESAEKLMSYQNIPDGLAKESYIYNILVADASNYTNAKDFIQRNVYYFAAPSVQTLEGNMPSNIRKGKISEDDLKANIDTLLTLFRTIHEIDLEDWDGSTLRKRLDWIVEQRTELGFKDKDEGETIISLNLTKRKAVSRSWSKFVHENLRWALFAGKPGPDGIKMMLLLGKVNVTERLLRAERLVRKMQENTSQETAPVTIPCNP
ncbi:BgTH12-07004 [Blumeria graminis f. sp. triticale]|uniref:Glutamate--tRNA ligase, mitochondrial n=3 Tax=Blumeria graminis TaxID=34373 RepID=A0A9X9QGF8_BLUGR|nr:Mitochondrial glutamyl-tRNA synthetase [Blumeria graminis f. sp. tritici 96224]CAD6506072.1 BgTH12-07004 [Blumeria graminis f. sp. triticale]VDB94737.1 Bgt-664 [Blumeria graminis f. sp. tritici]